MTQSASSLDWRQINYFSLSDNWGDLGLISKQLILNLDDFRGFLGARLYISPVKGAVQAKSGHSPNSMHYAIEAGGKVIRYCQAADVFPECELGYAFFQAIKCHYWGGVGIYPFQEWPKKGLRGGLHLDIRPDEYKKIWICDKDKKNHYLNNIKTIEYFLETMSNHGERKT